MKVLARALAQRAALVAGQVIIEECGHECGDDGQNDKQTFLPRRGLPRWLRLWATLEFQNVF